MRARSVSVVVYTLAPFRVLLLRRPASRAAGWQPVTGRVEPQDGGLEATCLREIAEEAGLPAPMELFDLALESTFVGYDAITYTQRAFAARYLEATPPRVSPEHEEARWVTLEEARALLRWHEDRAALDRLATRVAPTARHKEDRAF